MTRRSTPDSVLKRLVWPLVGLLSSIACARASETPKEANREPKTPGALTITPSRTTDGGMPEKRPIGSTLGYRDRPLGTGPRADELAPTAPAKVEAQPPVMRSDKLLSAADIAERSRNSIVTVRDERGLGSGFAVREGGWIATNAHVVRDGRRIVVVTSDDRVHRVVGVAAHDIPNDLVVLRIQTASPSPLPVGDSNAARPGERVIAIGAPLGLELTVSDGLISGKRKLSTGSRLLQMSAPISPGSSGGPVFNEYGEVVGIAVGLAKHGQNLNFAVPSEYLRALLDRPNPTTLAKLQETLRSRPSRR